MAASALPDGGSTDPAMLRAVAGIAVGVDLDAALHHLVDAAAELVGARYAALGVAGPGAEIDRFVTYGVESDTARRLAMRQHWQDVLVAVMGRARPIRLARAVGDPADPTPGPWHPPITPFLGVPVAVKDRVLGMLCLAGKAASASSSEFGEADEEAAVAVAAAAAIALENARLYEQAQRQLAWLAAATRTTQALVGASAADVEEGLWTAARAAREASGADVAALVSRPRGVSGASGPPTEGGPSPEMRTLLELPGPAVRDDAVLPEALGWPQVEQVLALPVRAGTPAASEAAGQADVLVLGWQRPIRLEPVDLAMATGFCEQVSLALDIARRAIDGRRLAVYQDRDRIARDLHDLVIQRLFAIGLSLQSVGRRLPGGASRERLEESVDELDATIREVRRTIYHLHVRDVDRGLRPAVERVVDEAAEALGFAPDLTVAGACEAVPRDLVADVVAVLHEALTNVARHAHATTTAVQVVVSEDVSVSVVDDGRGHRHEPAAPSVGHRGLANLAQRAVDRGGAFSVDAGPNGGSHLLWRVPREE